MRIDLETWLHAVCADPLTTQSAGKLACVLVRGFKNSSSGSYQVSFERLADLSGVYSLQTLRHSLDRLRSRGWLIVERDQRTPRDDLLANNTGRGRGRIRKTNPRPALSHGGPIR
jgi:hypothetical protein